MIPTTAPITVNHAKGLVPVDWRHADFGTVLRVHSLVHDATSALFDVDLPTAALELLDQAWVEAMGIDSDMIRQSWLNAITDDCEAVCELFDVELDGFTIRA